MKRLFLFFTITLISTIWLFGQDISPLPSVTVKKLISPNNTTFYYNTADSALWVFKGETGWLRIATNEQLKKYYVSKDTLQNYWNKQEITEADTTRWGNGGDLIQAPTRVGDLIGLTQTSTTIDISDKLPSVNVNGTAGYIPKFTGTNSIGNSPIYTDGIKVGVNNILLPYDFQVGSGSNNGYNVVGLDASIGIPSIHFGSLGSYVGYDYAGNERMIFNSRYVNSHYEFRINDVEKMRLESGGLTLYDLASTNPRLLSVSSTGQITPIADGTNGQVLGTDGNGGYSWVDKTTGTLSGTNVTWDYSIKKNYNITLTGNTVITITNVSDGDVGTLYVTNAAIPYTLTFAGYVNSIDSYIRLRSNMVITSGGSKSDDYTFKYNGTKLTWHGALDTK